MTTIAAWIVGLVCLAILAAIVMWIVNGIDSFLSDCRERGRTYNPDCDFDPDQVDLDAWVKEQEDAKKGKVVL